MNMTHGLIRSGSWLTYLVMLLALICATSTGCHSHALSKVPAAPIATTPAETIDPNPLAGMVPVQPFDERPIMPTETVGAATSN